MYEPHSTFRLYSCFSDRSTTVFNSREDLSQYSMKMQPWAAVLKRAK